MKRNNRGWVIVLSMLAAFMLATLPLPGWAAPWRPAWIVMVLVYWCIALPERVGVIAGWITGLIVDVMQGSVLGQHAFGLAFVAYIAVQYHQRFRVYPLFQQSIFIGLVVFVYLLAMWQVYSLVGATDYGPSYLLGAITTALLWPWSYIVLRDLRRRAQVL